MIVFDLACDNGHRFEGWFGSSDDYARQLDAGYVSCPHCGSDSVSKAVMAPAIGRKGNQLPVPVPRQAPEAAPQSGPQAGKPVPMSQPALPPEAMQMMRALAEMQAKSLKTSRWVGDSFAEDARAMHYGERDHEQIHGQATAREASELLEEGIAVMPLPFPVVPPGEAN